MNVWDKTSQGRQNARFRSKQYRERMKSKGMIELSEWVHKDDIKQVKNFISDLKMGAKYKQ